MLKDGMGLVDLVCIDEVSELSGTFKARELSTSGQLVNFRGRTSHSITSFELLNVFV